MTPTDDPYDAVVLAGGGARRLDGADKPGLLIGGRSLVAWVATAVAGAERLILVGAERPELPRAIPVREDPPGGGPVPALRAGLAMARSPWVAVLAADLPFLRSEHIDELRSRAHGGSGAVLDDDTGRPQWLAGVWRTPGLVGALEDYRGDSLRGLLSPLAPRRVRVPATGPPAWYDCDTPADVAAASRMMGENSARRVDQGGMRGARHRPQRGAPRPGPRSRP